MSEPLHPSAAAAHLHAAGFRYGGGIVNALATWWAESELGLYMRGPINADRTVGNYRWRDPDTGRISSTPVEGWTKFLHSIDRGHLMFNSVYHPEVSDACADDPACAAREAFRVSHRGSDFGAWTSFRFGRHRKHLLVARYAVALFHVIELGASKQRAADLALYTRTGEQPDE